MAEQGRIASALAWYRQRDRTLSALRRAGRTAILLPALFLVGQQVLHSSTVALFAAFGSFAMALLVVGGIANMWFFIPATTIFQTRSTSERRKCRS